MKKVSQYVATGLLALTVAGSAIAETKTVRCEGRNSPLNVFVNYDASTEMGTVYVDDVTYENVAVAADNTGYLAAASNDLILTVQQGEPGGPNLGELKVASETETKLLYCY